MDFPCDHQPSLQQVLSDGSDPHASPYVYRLTGIVSHKGTSARSGHYIADVWTASEDGVGDGSWTTYSDELATSGSTRAQIFARRRNTWTALFYTRQ